ncbi:MAG: flagellar M-ring protein FliF, partial [Verrucomicrobiae bacterium]|nr:flagellar M-ring protein FliF [Verrucomicrobiae bacterium]
MKTFAPFASELVAIWKQLGVNQRVSLVVAALVVVGGLAGLSLWASRPEYSLLYGRLDDAEAGVGQKTLDRCAHREDGPQAVIFDGVVQVGRD